MAALDVFLLTMRRPGPSGIPGGEGAVSLTRSEGASLPGGGSADVDSFPGSVGVDSFPGSADVDSFPGAVRVAAAFYGHGDAGGAASVRVSISGASGVRAGARRGARRGARCAIRFWRCSWELWE